MAEKMIAGGSGITVVSPDLSVVLSRAEQEIVYNYKQVLKSIREELNGIYTKYAINDKLTYAEMTKYNRLTNLFDSISKEIYSLSGQSNRLVRRLKKEIYQESYYRNAFNIAKAIGYDIKFGLINPNVIKASIANPFMDLAFDGLKNDLTGSITQAKRILTQGLIKGDSYIKVSREFSRIFNKPLNRSLLTVRTEGGRSQSMGQLASYDQAIEQGVNLQTMWVKSFNQYDRHGSLDGQKSDKDGMFTVRYRGVEYKAPAPRLFNIGDLDINCLCRIVAVIYGYQPTTRREKGVVMKFKTYDDWKKARK